ncbi:hypothetical protein, partial [Eubacterium limosum]|uniref:hypothetical protein n=1 Tax=Eubacterium limosum TaxID=1736 RepID=UPI001A9A6E25
ALLFLLFFQSSTFTQGFGDGVTNKRLCFDTVWGQPPGCGADFVNSPRPLHPCCPNPDDSVLSGMARVHRPGALGQEIS